MNAPKFEVSRITVNGKPALKLIVRNSIACAELHEIINTIGYKPTTDIRNAREIICFTKEDALSAREPIIRFFSDNGEFKG